jgi:hypothetical protein
VIALEEEDLMVELQKDLCAVVISGFGMQNVVEIFINECIECLDHERVMKRNSHNNCS